MNFKDALIALKNGDKIARSTWKGYQYLIINMDENGKKHVVSYTRRAIIFSYDSDTLLTDGWLMSDDLSELMTWDEVINVLLNGGSVRHKDWAEDAYIVYDRSQKAIVHYGMEISPYTPNFESFISNDWIIINKKKETEKCIFHSG